MVWTCGSPAIGPVPCRGDDMRQTLYDWCVENRKEYLLEEWNTARNLPLTPKDVSYGSSTRAVWWRCSLGHEYRSAISTRVTRGVGCPYCSGRRVLPGFNDLATREPEIAAQWYEPLNTPLTPQMVTVGSTRKVWWQCSEGHVWQAVIHSRTGNQRCGCPVCAGRVKKRRRYR